MTDYGPIARTRREAVVRFLEPGEGTTAAARAGEDRTMTLIRFTETTEASVDGTHVLRYAEGTTVDAPLTVARSLIEQGKAEAINVDGEAVDAPAEPPTAATDTRSALPPESATRAELDAQAAALGLDPADYGNKAEVRAAIEDALRAD